jgi:transcription-repair coupling factor (superfamily II helicase)
MSKKGEPDLFRGSALDLRAVVTELSQRIQQLGPLKNWSAESPICFEGTWLGGLSPLIASLTEIEPTPLLLVMGQTTDAETVSRDLDLLLGRPCEFFPSSSDEADVESLTQQEVLQRLQVISRLDIYHRSEPNKPTRKKAEDSQPNPPPPVIVATLPALMQPVPSPNQMVNDRRILRVGQRVALDELRTWMVANGYHSTTSVQLPGEFTVRGGILDVFPPDSPEPIRIEWFDDEIESIRSFDAVTQRSVLRMTVLELLNVNSSTQHGGTLLDYLGPNAKVVIHEPLMVENLAAGFLARVPFPDRFIDPKIIMRQLMQRRHLTTTQLADAGYLGTLERLPIGDVQRIGGELDQLTAEIDQAAGADRHVVLVSVNAGESERMADLLANSQVKQTNRLHLIVGGIVSGFELPPNGLMVLTVSQLLRRGQLRRGTRKIPSRAIDSFLDLRDGDLVVHLAHGIGVYRGLQLIAKHGQRLEHLEIEFAEGSKLFVPTSKIDLVQRYVGGTKSRPKLAKLGSQTWVRQKKAAEAAVTDMAAELLELQAQRRSQPGISFSEDTVWQHQFDASFPYEETQDQITAIAAIKKDMVAARPMDRLICGDVGFGKTEVAMRAAFKAIDSGYQVAVLVPTTVLAEQHYKTFRERMAEFPFDIARLSRFCTGSQQKEILHRLAKGNIDIVIGTHRLASADVEFFNLGLVVVDEEQRFGVGVKESLKRSRPNVDLLTLSATPIPRTLHMSLLGVRDISNLETAPEERLAVETKVVRFNDTIIRNAILRELNRGGQVYFVHNRINDLLELAERLQRIAPEARIAIGHGQMPEHHLEHVMIDFIEHRCDVLLSTTIIESGLDIPNANTIFINEADRYGLAELHQLRGRVGRYKHQAHCYLLIGRHKHLNPEASRRLHAIQEYSQIGAGFGIAMRDLEIRGAGNLLGTQQSGHIAAVGYELYCQLLENAVRQLTHQPPRLSVEVEINLPIEAFIPADYVPEIRHKIDLYRRLSRLDSIDQLRDIERELDDRFGPPPASVKRLLELAELRIDAAVWLVRYVGIDEDHMVLTYADRNRIEQLSRRHQGKLKVLDKQKAYWKIPEGPQDLLRIAQSLLRVTN